MSGEVSRSRQKKAGSSGGGGGKKGQQQSSNNVQAAHRQYANKKKSKERQQQQKMNQKSGGSWFCCSAWTWLLLLALTGVSMATYHQHPEQFQQVYDNLPPQVKYKPMKLLVLTSGPSRVKLRNQSNRVFCLADRMESG